MPVPLHNRDIVLNDPEYAALVQRRKVGPYKIGDYQITIRLAEAVGTKGMIAAVLDIMGTDGAHTDPPEAREFLPRGNARRKGRA